MVQARDEEHRDGSQTARVRGTYGARQRWISQGSKPDQVSTPTTRTVPRVSGNVIESYLGSLGYAAGDEAALIKKEIEEVSMLRKEHDTLKNLGVKKQQELKNLEESLAELHKFSNNSKEILSLKDASVTKLENKIESIEHKLEEELADGGVYKHMIRRLTDELHASKLVTKTKEEENRKLSHELQAHQAHLLASRQEKSAAEQLLKSIHEEFQKSIDDNNRAISELDAALDQTRKRAEIVKKREKSRMKLLAQANGELTTKEVRKLLTVNVANHFKYNKVLQMGARTDKKYRDLEANLYQIAEAAGTHDIEKIVAKFLSRDETLEALKKEYGEAELRMKRLREKHTQLKEKLQTLRGSATNTRGVYMEMDEISSKLKEIEKNGAQTEERCRRVELTLESLRTSMLKSINKLNSIKYSHSFEFQIDKRDVPAANLLEASLNELLQMAETKVARVMDSIMREKADAELSRAEMAQKLRPKDQNETQNGLLIPAPNETEEHFILRVCKPDVSKNNVRVSPKINLPTNDLKSLVPDETADDNETIIDRGTRKKLAGMVINREKRNRRNNVS